MMGEEGERNEIYPYMKFLEFLISKIRQSTIVVKYRNKHLFILSCVVVLTKCYGSYFITTVELLQRVKKTCSLHTHCMHYACLLLFPSNAAQHTLESSFLSMVENPPHKSHCGLVLVWYCGYLLQDSIPMLGFRAFRQATNTTVNHYWPFFTRQELFGGKFNLRNLKKIKNIIPHIQTSKTFMVNDGSTPMLMKENLLIGFSSSPLK